MWLATTDADSTVPGAWLEYQIAQRARGIEAWTGTVVVDRDASGPGSGGHRLWWTRAAGADATAAIAMAAAINLKGVSIVHPRSRAGKLDGRRPAVNPSAGGCGK